MNRCFFLSLLHNHVMFSFYSLGGRDSAAEIGLLNYGNKEITLADFYGKEVEVEFCGTSLSARW